MSVAYEIANRDAVLAELAVLRARLRAEATDVAEAALIEARRALPAPSALDEIVAGLGLSEFERSVLLLAAGPELVAATADDIATLGAGPHLTFGTALTALPGAHWSALTPDAPLRRWDLVSLLDPTSPTRSPLIISEWVLHYIAGAPHLDPLLAALCQPIGPPRLLPQALDELADDLVRAWQVHRTVVAHGSQPANVRGVTAGAADRIGLVTYELAAGDLPSDPALRADMFRRMEREAVLSGCAWVINTMAADVEHRSALIRALRTIQAPVVVLADTDEVASIADTVAFPVRRLTVEERRSALRDTLQLHGADVSMAIPPQQEIDSAVGVFDLAVDDLDAVARSVRAGGDLWEACRSRTRPTLGRLATIIEPRAKWDELVLPESQKAQLRALVSSVRHRHRVLDEWGFADRTSRGLGTTVLFAGPSGTGKTFAAEVIAHELGLVLAHIDLSQVVSKYIGETEKHLGRLFDAAESGGAVLLFDEADAIFGHRSEVRDSHDRYANIEVGYLLQRIEAFRGLAILTTNARSTLDQAFTRRIRTIVTFPYPDAAMRQALWERAFPEQTPLDGIEPRHFASTDLPGGGIAGVALSAAFLAADDGGSVRADHVATATRWELAKSGRAVARAEVTRARPQGAR